MSWFRVWLDPGVQRDCRVLCLCLPPPSPLTSALASRPHDLPVQTGSFLEPRDLRPAEAKLRLPSAQPNQIAPAHEDPGRLCLANRGARAVDWGTRVGLAWAEGLPVRRVRLYLPAEAAVPIRTTATECREQTPQSLRGQGALTRKEKGMQGRQKRGASPRYLMELWEAPSGSARTNMPCLRDLSPSTPPTRSQARLAFY